jgi:hypothetical protein
MPHSVYANVPSSRAGRRPVYVGVLVWGGLLLREDRLRALIPLRR